uniref:Probable ATP-dependent RNA helicase DDX52 n=1 Tax=Crassostrea virginica TaxID=6565 RepID=A0A8B8E625_CRAVI|nr:probable ATP-dependent RNA helicase DDX52 [Crassostrea virginica]
MDGFGLFRKLGIGTKFDFERFKNDARVLNVLPSASANQATSQEHVQKKKENKNRGTAEIHVELEDDVEEEEISQVNDEPEDFTEEGEFTVLQGMRKKGERQHSMKSKQSFAQMKQEKINHIRNKNRIHCFGQDPPDPCVSFDHLAAVYGVNPLIIKNIASVGYTKPTPIQIQAIPAMMERREILACAPTGSGKTAAFLLPIMHHLKEHREIGYRALILAPTRELAKQIYREFLRLSEGIGLKANYINKANTEKHVEKKYDVLVSTPNRLVYMLKEDPPMINLSHVEWLVIDESDKLFEDGRTGFRDQLAKVYQACSSSNVKRAMFSATFAMDVEEWCKLNLDNVLQVYIGSKNSATTTIEQELKFVGTESGKLLAVRDIIAKGVQPPVLIFVQSKERARELFHELIYDGMNVDVIHSDQTQEQRRGCQKFRSGKTWILICTELMGRGMDFIGVNLVINYDFPNSAISYIHRIGRTGRAGRSGKAVTLFTESDSVYLRSIARVMVNAGCPVPDYMLDMKRPNKKIRRAAKKVPKRDRISTVAQYDIDKINKKRKYISSKQDQRKQNDRKKLKRDPDKS